jgi:hypothetical protein
MNVPTTVNTSNLVPPVWLYWVLHIGAWVVGILVPVILFFVAKGMDTPPRNNYS